MFKGANPKLLYALSLFCLQDMAAHSACEFGGGKAERMALAKYRQVIWQGRVLNSQFTDKELRNQGRCPLTPEEIGLLLAALGFSNTTRLYLASHKVYCYVHFHFPCWLMIAHLTVFMIRILDIPSMTYTRTIFLEN